MASVTRVFAALLFFLFLLVGVSLAGSLRLRHDLLPNAAIADGPMGADLRDRLDDIRTLRAWTTAAQIASLLACAALCGLGLRIRFQGVMEARRREDAERELERERRALEKRIEDRTRELRTEVDERRRAEELNRGQKQVLEMLMRSGEKSTEEILTHLAHTLAAQRRFWECTIHLVDRGSCALRLAGSSNLDEKLCRNLRTIGTDLADAPESRACASGELQVVERMAEVRRPWSELLVANGILSAWSCPFRAAAEGEVTGTITIYSWLQNTPSPRTLELLDAAGNLAGLVVEHRRIHAQLVDHAYRDSLTELPNRRAGELAIMDTIEEAERELDMVAVLWIDVDRFKRINDQFGHEAGDVVLRTVAGRLRTHVGARGKLARMGGDEFLVLLPGAAETVAAEQMARELAEKIAEPMDLGATTISVTASIGICLYPRDGSAMDILQRNADVAMYRAKAAGSGMCVYSPGMSEESNQVLEIESALRDALDRNLFELAYQPMFLREDGLELQGFEALLRLNHPRLGRISPARFIPVAEETRLIEPIGEWVLETAVRQLRKWHLAGAATVRMSVNISVLQFVRPDFAEAVQDVLGRCGLTAEHLILELTESAVMEDLRAVVRQMNLLRECGVRLAIDDFGTGHSSLSYLHRLPIHILKIDRSFVERLDTVESTRPIVEAVISMAQHLELATVAEGVETEEQLNMLQKAGCSAYQGFLLGRPMTALDAETLLFADKGQMRVGASRMA